MIDFWFTIGSTYTYLSVMRLDRVAADEGVRFSWRPFNRQAAANAGTPFQQGTAKFAYMWRDIERRAAMYGIPVRVPAPYPPENSTLANRIALLGMKEGWGRDFVRAAYAFCLQHGQSMGGGENIKNSLSQIGQDPERVVPLAQGEAISKLWDSETEQARELGVFGSPTFAVGREIFWGDDHLEDAIAWYKNGTLVR